MRSLTLQQRKEVNELYSIVSINKDLFNHSRIFRETLERQYDIKVVDKVKKMIDT